MADELKESGTVTALSVVGFVFGLIGMLGSFIPCIGSLAFYISFPSLIVSIIALVVAYNLKAEKSFAIVALTVGMIGTIVYSHQYYSFIHELKRQTYPISLNQLEELTKSHRLNDYLLSEEISRLGLASTPNEKVIDDLKRYGAGPMTIRAVSGLQLTLENAKEIISNNLKRILNSLDQGNLKAIRPLLVNSLISNTRKLDSVCLPYRYRAHYIESIIERPRRRYLARTRVLLKPLEEHALVLIFKQEGGGIILEDAVDALEIYALEYQDDINAWFGEWKAIAAEYAKKTYYALKAERRDVISDMSSSDKISFKPLFQYMELTPSQIKDRIDPDSIRTEIVSNKGIKVKATFDITGKTSVNSESTQCSLYIEPISNEFKIVMWGAENPSKSPLNNMIGILHGKKSMKTKSYEIDPNVELYTLNRFSSKTSSINPIEKKK